MLPNFEQKKMNFKTYIAICFFALTGVYALKAQKKICYTTEEYLL